MVQLNTSETNPNYLQEAFGDVQQQPQSSPQTPQVTPEVGGRTVLEQFANVIQQGNPLEIARMQKEQGINIPLEFDNLGEATKEIRNLIFAYDLYQEGAYDEEDWQYYLDTKWLGKKPVATENKVNTNVAYRNKAGDIFYPLLEGPDAPGVWNVSKNRKYDEVQDGPMSEMVREKSGQTGSDVYDKKTAAQAAEFSEALRGQVEVAQKVEAEANTAINILERYPRVAGTLNISDVSDPLTTVGKSVAQFFKNGANVIWGSVDLDITDIIQNVTLTDVEKAQLELLKSAFSRLSTVARQELAGQGPITDAEAEAVARQFGTLDSGASAVIAVLRLALFRAQVNTLQFQAWTDLKREAQAQNSYPDPDEFMAKIWPPIRAEKMAELDVVALGQIAVEDPESSKSDFNPNTGDIKKGTKMKGWGSASDDSYTVVEGIGGESGAQKGVVKNDETGKSYTLYFGNPAAIGGPSGNNWYIIGWNSLYYFLFPVESQNLNTGGKVSVNTLKGGDNMVMMDKSMEVSPGGGFAGPVGEYVSAFAKRHNIDFTDANLENIEKMVMEADDDWGTLPQREKDEWGNFDDFVDNYYESGEYNIDTPKKPSDKPVEFKPMQMQPMQMQPSKPVGGMLGNTQPMKPMGSRGLLG